ncbi:filamentous hemagglutinin N-terminal domain-containing protein [Oxalobacteraceae bacterium CAVE-383]|nr:filamentous hemagglutinin N-terminal domain-containing protein [Oxalobacteraceae bacterium CAVE-383]
MHTSLVSTAASSLSASIKAGVKADPAPQLKSVAVYFRGRKMVLMQRPQRRLSLLLCRMLRRSMLNLLGRLPAKLAAPLIVPMKRALSAGALCAMALASATTAHATAVTDTTLPTDYSVKYGQVGVSTTGNQMNVNIGTDKAIINWNSFSIGSQAGVDFHFNSATASSSVLNRVTGNDPSQIMGSLTSNGKVFLINAAGILVGKTAKIDVAGFTASTLNLHNTDFLNDKLSFNGNPASTAGVVIEQDGSIKTRDGGSVYLIGANVENNGVITSPGGEVLLAAGSSVDLVDTGTPGVKINVKAGQGKVTNLGKIIAETGTIGFGAALINNGGVISASSVTKEGGRIFLRASQDLTTTETSSINADGTTGGNVVLYADGSANINGDVSALGSVGNGGYVDTSGKMSLAVKYVPRVGKGGEWYIDPVNVDIVGSGADLDPNIDGVITATSNSSTISASVIQAALNDGANITISTGTGGPEAGDITVQSDAHINKSTGGAATLTLSAAGNITLNSGASIEDSSAGALSLVLNAGYDSGTGTATGAITSSGGNIKLLGGDMHANGASFSNGGTLTLGGGTLTSISDIHNDTNGTIAGTGTINLVGGTHTLFNDAGINTSTGGVYAGQGVIVGSDSSHTGTLNINGNYAQGANGVLQVKVGADGMGVLESDTLAVTGNVSLAGYLKVDALNGSYVPAKGDKFTILTYGGTRSDNSAFVAQVGLDTMYANYLMPMSGSNHVIGAGFGTSGSNYFSGAAGTLNWEDGANWSGGTPVTSANIYIDVGSSYSVLHTSALHAAMNALDIASGTLDITDGTVDVGGTASISGTLKVEGTGQLIFNRVVSGSGTLAIGGTAAVTLNPDEQSSSIDHLTMSGGTFNSSAIFSTGDLNMTGGAIVSDASAAFSVNGNFSQTAGTITINGSGSFEQATGNLVLGTIGGSGALTLNADEGAITQHTGTTLAANSIDATATGGITLNNSGNILSGENAYFTATNNGTGDIVLKNDGTDSLTLNGISNANGSITVSTAGALSTDDTVTAGGDINLTSAGDLSAWSWLSAQNVNLTSTGGSISQGEGSITAGTVSARASGDIDLTGYDNEFQNFSGSATGNVSVASSGDLTIGIAGITGGSITLTTRSMSQALEVEEGPPPTSDLMINGQLTANGTGDSGYVQLSSGGAITQNANGTISGQLLQVTSADGDVTLTAAPNQVTAMNLNGGSGNMSVSSSGSFSVVLTNYGGSSNITSTDGNITLNGISASDLTLHADHGSVAQAMFYGLNADTLDVHARDGINLDVACATVSVGNFSAANTGTGDITLSNHNGERTSSALVSISNNGGNVSVTNHGALETTGEIRAQNIALTTVTDGQSSDLAINGILTATGNIDLISDTGAITQSAGISAASLTATAVTGITLNSGSNTVSAFGATNSGSGAAGDIVFKNTSTGISGGTLTTSAITNDAGNISVENTGAMVVGDTISAPAGAISLVTHSPLTINGTVNANGNINMAAGSTINATAVDNLTVNAAVTSAAGAVGLAAGNGVTLRAIVTGPTGFNVAAHTFISTVQQPVAPDVTVTAGPQVVITPPSTPVVVNTTTIDQNVASTTKTVNNVTDTTTTPVTTTTQSNTLNSASSQTAGGGDGEFGGTKDDGKGGKGEKSNKPLPICS